MGGDHDFLESNLSLRSFIPSFLVLPGHFVPPHTITHSCSLFLEGSHATSNTNDQITSAAYSSLTPSADYRDTRTIKMAEPDNFEEDLFADLYTDEVAPPKSAAPEVELKAEPAQEVVKAEESHDQTEPNGQGGEETSTDWSSKCPSSKCANRTEECWKARC